MPLRHAVLACHVVLIGALVASVLPPATALRLGIAGLAVLPLALTLPGVVQRRRATLQWLAVLLVAYIGGLSVEVVARSGGDPALEIALMGAVLELGLALALIRRSAPSAPRARE